MLKLARSSSPARSHQSKRHSGHETRNKRIPRVHRLERRQENQPSENRSRAPKHQITMGQTHPQRQRQEQEWEGEVKTIHRLNCDPRVMEAWSETGTDDGYWVMLKPGFADTGFDPCQPTHTIHEWTIKAILFRMKDVKECNCKECQAELVSPNPHAKGLRK